MNLDLLTPRLKAGISPCGCLHESLRRHRVIQVWRCSIHDDWYVRAEALWPRRRCESCWTRRARYRLTFGDGVSFRLCFECEPERWR
jgi:hypothetical protein